MTATMNHSLPSLPSIAGTPLNRPKSHAALCALLDLRLEAAQSVAHNTLALAKTVLSRGDVEAARDLIAEAHLYMAEADAIRAHQVTLT